MWLLPVLPGLLTVSRTSAAQDPPVPTIHLGRSFDFLSAAGVTYVLEGSEDGQQWVTVVEPLFGDGGRVAARIPDGTPEYGHWRLRLVDGTLYGPAITGFSGRTLALNDSGRPRQLIFFPETDGVRSGVLKTDAGHARSFIWTARRTTGARTLMELTYRDGTRSTVELDFIRNRLGSYLMRDYNAAGAVNVTEGGAFSVHQGRIREQARQATLPVSMAGQQVLLDEGGANTLLEFGHAGKVTVTSPDGTVETVDYEYQRRQPDQAELRIDPATAQQIMQVLQMQVNSQATGTFTRVPIILPGNTPVPGVLPQPGTFNIPTGIPVTNSTTGPPASLGGKVLELNGEEEVKLTFHEDGSGTATREDNGSVEVTPFLYNYAPTDEDEASLALTFPGASNDRVEDYNLDFSSGTGGSFQRSTFEGGEIAQNTSGSFNAGGGTGN